MYRKSIKPLSPLDIFFSKISTNDVGDVVKIYGFFLIFSLEAVYEAIRV